MRKVAGLSVAAAAGLLVAVAAQAGVSLDAARVGGPHVAALAKFYESAFGLKEVNRLHVARGMIEIMLNFGDTVAEAKANKAAQILIMHRPAATTSDPVPHIIFRVTDMSATAAAIKAAGGAMAGKPREFGKTGIVVGIATDPAGNRLELLQMPQA